MGMGKGQAAGAGKLKGWRLTSNRLRLQGRRILLHCRERPCSGIRASTHPQAPWRLQTAVLPTTLAQPAGPTPARPLPTLAASYSARSGLIFSVRFSYVAYSVAWLKASLPRGEAEVRRRGWGGVGGTHEGLAEGWPAQTLASRACSPARPAQSSRAGALSNTFLARSRCPCASAQLQQA